MKVLLTLGLFLSLVIAAVAVSVTLAWDPSTGPSVNRYDVYYGVASGAYTNHVEVTNQLTATVSNLALNTVYFFAATAKDTNDLESDFSSEVFYDTTFARLPPVQGLRVFRR